MTVVVLQGSIQTGSATPGRPGGHGPPTFLHSKKKKGKQREKRKGFKAETIKRLSPRSKYYCFNHSRASRIQKFFHGPSTLKSISPALIHRNTESTKDVDIHNNIQTLIFTNNTWKKESKQLYSNSDVTTSLL